MAIVIIGILVAGFAVVERGAAAQAVESDRIAALWARQAARKAVR